MGKKYVVALWQYDFFRESSTRIINEFRTKRNAMKEYEECCKDESVMVCSLFKRIRNGKIKILRSYHR